MEKASINYRNTILSIVEALEKVPEGRHATFDAFTSFAMRLRQPVRQSDTASSAQLEDLHPVFAKVLNFEIPYICKISQKFKKI